MAETISHMDTVNTAIVLSEEEAAELYRFTQYDYISGNVYPALSKLLVRVKRHLRHGQVSELDAQR